MKQKGSWFEKQLVSEGMFSISSPQTVIINCCEKLKLKYTAPAFLLGTNPQSPFLVHLVPANKLPAVEKLLP